MTEQSPTSKPPRRFRFGLRTLFVLVTLAAVGIGGWKLKQRRDEFVAKAITYVMIATILENASGEDELRERYKRLAHKYIYAADHPWFPVEYDPLEPLSEPQD